MAQIKVYESHTRYTPQNSLRTIEIYYYSFRVNLWAKEVFAASFRYTHDAEHIAISVAIKMSVAPTRSDQKIVRKMGISESQAFTPK